MPVASDDHIVTTVRFEAKLLDRIRDAARRERRTLSGEIATLIEEAFATRDIRASPAPPAKPRAR
jgi:hypothetical protein